MANEVSDKEEQQAQDSPEPIKPKNLKKIIFGWAVGLPKTISNISHKILNIVQKIIRLNLISGLIASIPIAIFSTDLITLITAPRDEVEFHSISLDKISQPRNTVTEINDFNSFSNSLKNIFSDNKYQQITIIFKHPKEGKIKSILKTQYSNQNTYRHYKKYFDLNDTYWVYRIKKEHVDEVTITKNILDVITYLMISIYAFFKLRSISAWLANKKQPNYYSWNTIKYSRSLSLAFGVAGGTSWGLGLAFNQSIFQAEPLILILLPSIILILTFTSSFLILPDNSNHKKSDSNEDDKPETTSDKPQQEKKKLNK